LCAIGAVRRDAHVGCAGGRWSGEGGARGRGSRIYVRAGSACVSFLSTALSGAGVSILASLYLVAFCTQMEKEKAWNLSYAPNFKHKKEFTYNIGN